MTSACLGHGLKPCDQDRGALFGDGWSRLGEFAAEQSARSARPEPLEWPAVPTRSSAPLGSCTERPLFVGLGCRHRDAHLLLAVPFSIPPDRRFESCSSAGPERDDPLPQRGPLRRAARLCSAAVLRRVADCPPFYRRAPSRMVTHARPFRRPGWLRDLR